MVLCHGRHEYGGGMRLLGHEWYAVYDGNVTSSISVRTISVRGVLGHSITISAP